MVTQPDEIKTSAGMSYYQTNFSSRNLVDRIRLQRIATPALQAIKVRSRYGKTKTWMIDADMRHINPISHFHVQ